MDYIFVFVAKYFYLLSLALGLVWLWKMPKDKRLPTIFLGIFTCSIIYLVSLAAGWLYFDPRPFVVGHFTPLLYHAPDNGFPSDHVLLTSAIAAFLFIDNKKFSMAAWFIAISVGVARVYVGVHHVIDIFGSIIISIAVTASIFYIFRNYFRKIFSS